MRRADRGAGWRTADRGNSSKTGRRAAFVEPDDVHIQAEEGSGAAARAWHDRFSRALFTQTGLGLHRSIRITPGEGVDWAEEYLGLVDALGIGAELLAGVWRGEAGEVFRSFGQPTAEVNLRPGSDLDLVIWRSSREELPRFLRAARNCPTLLATIELGWVLIAPPADDDMFLYPEVSASQG